MRVTDCAPIIWSVSPEGASIVHFNGDSRRGAQVQLNIYGLVQTYTVTATSGALTKSIDITPTPRRAR